MAQDSSQHLELSLFESASEKGGPRVYHDRAGNGEMTAIWKLLQHSTWWRLFALCELLLYSSNKQCDFHHTTTSVQSVFLRIAAAPKLKPVPHSIFLPFYPQPISATFQIGLVSAGIIPLGSLLSKSCLRRIQRLCERKRFWGVCGCFFFL